jgi:hypothetical protein
LDLLLHKSTTTTTRIGQQTYKDLMRKPLSALHHHHHFRSAASVAVVVTASMLVWLIGISTALLLVAMSIHLRSRFQSMVGPTAYPIIGNILDYIFVGNNHMLVIQNMYRRHGSTFHAFLPGLPIGMRLVFVHRAEHVKHILSDAFKQGKYGKGDFLRGAYYDFLGDGIFNTNGEQWELQRHTASHLFRTSNLKLHLNVFTRQAHKLVTRLQALPATSAVDLQDFFLRYTLDSFAEIGMAIALAHSWSASL